MKLVKCHNGKNKYTAIFKNGRKVSFGAIGYQDFTLFKDKETALRRRKAYRSRHKGDNLRDPYSKGSLSWNILWGNNRSVTKNLAEYNRKWNV